MRMVRQSYSFGGVFYLHPQSARQPPRSVYSQSSCSTHHQKPYRSLTRTLSRCRRTARSSSPSLAWAPWARCVARVLHEVVHGVHLTDVVLITSRHQAISENLIKNGNLEKPLLVWNRTHATAEKHAAKLGPQSAEAVEDLASIIDRSDFVWSCVASQAAVLSIYETILSFDSLKGKIFVESSTVKSHTTDELAEKVVAKGGEFVAMPGTNFVLTDRMCIWLTSRQCLVSPASRSRPSSSLFPPAQRRQSPRSSRT